MQNDVAFAAAYRAARTRYELGRLVTATGRSALAAVVVAVLATLVLGKSALVWLPATLLVLTFTEWRGVFLMKGARRGALVGIASMLLPLSVLRPCCGLDAKAMGASCCIMPSACWATGALVGLGMALLLPNAPVGQRARAAVGMLLGVLSVAVLRCSMLFWGEAFGLLGGIVAGVIATGLGRQVLERLRHAA